MGTISDIKVIEILAELGVFDIFAPFLMVYAIVFGVLEMCQAFKRNKKDPIGRRLHAVFALTYALYVVRNVDVVKWIKEATPEFTLLLLIIAGLFMLIGVLSGEGYKVKGLMKGVVAFASLCIVYYIYLSKMLFPKSEGAGIQISEEVIAIIIVLLMMLGVVAFVTSGPKQDRGSGGYYGYYNQ